VSTDDQGASTERQGRLSRRRFMQLSLTATALTGVPVALAACGSAPAAPAADTTAATAPTTAASGATAAATAAATPRPGGTLVVASYDPDTLDPHLSEQTSAGPPLSLLFDTLVTVSPTGEFEGLLAESWDTSDDGLVVTFMLREGIEFHDGTPLDAAAVKASFDRYTQVSYTDVLESIEVVDPRTVRFTLLEPYAPFLADLVEPWSGIISPTAFAEYGEEFGRNPVGSGPFRFQEWAPGERVTLVRNENYRNVRSYRENKGPAYFEQVVFRAIPETQTLVASLEAGEVHVGDIGRADLGSSAANVPYRFLENSQGIGVLALWFTMRRDGTTVTFKPPFDDLRVRQAVGHALNIDDIIAGVVGEGGQANRTPVPYGSQVYSEEIAQQHGYAFDLAKAQQLLDEAGWALGADGVRAKDGQPLALQLYTNNSTDRQRISELIQNQLTQAGFSVSIQAIELGSFIDTVDTGESDITLLQSSNPDPDLLYGMTESEPTGVYSYQDYNPQFAELVQRARGTYTMEERIPLYHEAQRLFLADPQFIPLLTYIGTLTARPEVQGLGIGFRNIPIIHDAYFAA
jgi:peptide/nickel transport system substrate-binding protein